MTFLDAFLLRLRDAAANRDRFLLQPAEVGAVIELLEAAQAITGGPKGETLSERYGAPVGVLAASLGLTWAQAGGESALLVQVLAVYLLGVVFAVAHLLGEKPPRRVVLALAVAAGLLAGVALLTPLAVPFL